METAVRDRVVVVGQGYVGLPLSMRAVAAGFDVVGLDVSVARIDQLRAGVSVIGDVSAEELRRALASGKYMPTCDWSEAHGFEFAVVTVPTPLSEGSPDLSYIDAAARSLAPAIRPGSTVILESTTYPGTTEEMVIPILETSGLKAGSDFSVGYSPERIDPGNATFSLANTPKVISGVDASSLSQVRRFYERVVDEIVPVSTCRVAELSKLLENTFRHVNIALVNELAMYAHDLDIDIWEAISAASSKPFGYMPFTPGPGVGGHCLPIDPSYLSWRVKRALGLSFRFVELANDINDHMPDYVVRRLTASLNTHRKSVNGSRVLLLGLSYKKNTGDPREAPTRRVIELLLEMGADVSVADPHVVESHLDRRVRRVDLTQEECDRSDFVVVLVDHDKFDYEILKHSSSPVLDTRHCVSGPTVEYL